MSEIKELEKLRDRQYMPGYHGDLTLEQIADEIEREIAERFMELPVGADNLPIRVGDVVEFGENRNQGIVKALNEHMVIAMHVDDGCMNYAKYGLLWNADACHHVKPRTIEDVLRDFTRRSVRIGMAGGVPADTELYADEDAIAECADEIRELMGGKE